MSSAASLLASGKKAPELKQMGYSASDLRTAGDSIANVIQAGYDLATLRTAGYTLVELRNAGIPLSLLSAKVSNPTPLLTTTITYNATSGAISTIQDTNGTNLLQSKTIGNNADDILNPTTLAFGTGGSLITFPSSLQSAYNTTILNLWKSNSANTMSYQSATTFPSLTTKTPSSTLLAQYAFQTASNNRIYNNVSGTYDIALSSNAAINTTVNSGCLQLTTGYALSVSAASFVSDNTGLSFSFWFKCANTGSYSRVFALQSGSFTNIISFLVTNNNKIGISIDSGTTHYDYFDTYNLTVNDGVWRHVVPSLTISRLRSTLLRSPVLNYLLATTTMATAISLGTLTNSKCIPVSSPLQMPPPYITNIVPPLHPLPSQVPFIPHPVTQISILPPLQIRRNWLSEPLILRMKCGFTV
jgi:hypothetical protein